MKHPRKHLIIPDTQVKPGVPIQHMTWIGRYAAEKRPDVIVHLGDHWDMPSLSSYDRGKRAFEGRRYRQDIDAGNRALELLTNPIARVAGWRPTLIMLRGNHEQRIERAIEENAVLDGTIGYDDFNELDLGWEPSNYLEPILIDGIWYCHYFYNPKTGRPWGGDARFKLGKIHSSFTQGHVQGLDACQLETAGGKRLRGLVAGSCYLHSETYIGPQGNNEWRGVLMKHEVRGGQYDLMEVSLDYLKRRFA